MGLDAWGVDCRFLERGCLWFYIFYLWQGSVIFEDVVVYFFWEEWGFFDEIQRCFYYDVMLENFVFVISFGCWYGMEDEEVFFVQCVFVE